jgi:hypothetical protein
VYACMQVPGVHACCMRGVEVSQLTSNFKLSILQKRAGQ